MHSINVEDQSVEQTWSKVIRAFVYSVLYSRDDITILPIPLMYYYIIKPYHIIGFNRIMAIYVKHNKIDECFVYIPTLYLSVEHEFSEQKWWRTERTKGTYAQRCGTDRRWHVAIADRSPCRGSCKCGAALSSKGGDGGRCAWKPIVTSA